MEGMTGRDIRDKRGKIEVRAGQKTGEGEQASL